ncbi:hypothetical protein A5893_15745 [Pedobacter psychrophilus]|uniref:STAS/SEC14 domain-containing protein n=1 Tax=Pedobacter psychrophilus TaxID=1826909 RepID=A0A179DB21_9SPHI|nr:STAS/SEC14 domain-containing protein [Pedobacter psychrophilus]OAQ38246.1 hypothetical protein A5893_15745 [Pedobacter psychrophilus]
MLTIIENLPAHVVGIEASGEVDADQVADVIIPALKLQVENYDEINYLLVLKTDVKNWSGGAWLQDLKAGVQNLTKWNKIAVATDEKMVEKFSDMFSVLSPGESKGFKLSEIEEAKKWVSAKS